MSHESLENFYRTNFALMQHHKYSLTELENMIPWEREIYVTLLSQYIEEENLKAQQQNGDNLEPKVSDLEQRADDADNALIWRISLDLSGLNTSIKIRR